MKANDPFYDVPLTAMILLETVTAKGKRYYMDGKRVSREHKLSLNIYRQDSFVTRVESNAVRNWSTIYVPA